MKSELKKIKARHDEMVNIFRNKITSKIDQLPDNPNINRIGSYFEVSSKDVLPNMDPFYHDWKNQHDLLIRIINHFDLAYSEKKLEELFNSKTGRITHLSKSYLFHPEVVKQIKAIWEGTDVID